MPRKRKPKPLVIRLSSEVDNFEPLHCGNLNCLATMEPPWYSIEIATFVGGMVRPICQNCMDQMERMLFHIQIEQPEA